jgi:hypothetical protein
MNGQCLLGTGFTRAFSHCTLLQQSLFTADISWAAVKDVPINKYSPFAGPSFKASWLEVMAKLQGVMRRGSYQVKRRYPCVWPCYSPGDQSPASHRGCPGSSPGHVRFEVDKMTLGQASSEYFGCTCQFLFHRRLHIHHHLSSRTDTIGQLVDDLPSGLSLTPWEK